MSSGRKHNHNKGITSQQGWPSKAFLGPEGAQHCDSTPMHMPQRITCRKEGCRAAWHGKNICRWVGKVGLSGNRKGHELSPPPQHCHHTVPIINTVFVIVLAAPDRQASGHVTAAPWQFMAQSPAAAVAEPYHAAATAASAGSSRQGCWKPCTSGTYSRLPPLPSLRSV